MSCVVIMLIALVRYLRRARLLSLVHPLLPDISWEKSELTSLQRAIDGTLTASAATPVALCSIPMRISSCSEMAL